MNSAPNTVDDAPAHQPAQQQQPPSVSSSSSFGGGSGANVQLDAAAAAAAALGQQLMQSQHQQQQLLPPKRPRKRTRRYSDAAEAESPTDKGRADLPPSTPAVGSKTDATAGSRRKAMISNNSANNMSIQSMLMSIPTMQDPAVAVSDALSLPIIRIPKNIYLSLLVASPFTWLPQNQASASNGPFMPPPQLPHQSQHQQMFILTGVKEIIDRRLHLQISALHPVDDSTLMTVLTSLLSRSDGISVLGFAMTTQANDVAVQLEAVAAAQANKLFQSFHAAVIRHFAQFYKAYSSDSGTASKFATDVLAQLQDTIGLITLTGMRVLGRAVVMPFDTPDVSLAEVERRLANLSSSSTVSSMPFSLSQIPPSCIHVLPGVDAAFIGRILSADNLLEHQPDCIPPGFELKLGDGALKSKVDREEDSRTCEKLKSMVVDPNGPLCKALDEYTRRFDRLKELSVLAEALGRVGADDVVRAALLSAGAIGGGAF